MTITQQEIIALAVEAGFNVGKDEGGEYVAPKHGDSVATLERFAAFIGFRVFEKERQIQAIAVDEAYQRGVRDEREACASICDDRSELYADEGSDARSCAYAIRARSAE